MGWREETGLPSFHEFSPGERCCEERPGSWGRLGGWDITSAGAGQISQVVLAAEGEGSAQKLEGLRSQWGDFRRHRAEASWGIQAPVEAPATPWSVTACSGHVTSFEPHSGLLRRHL